MGQVAVIVAFNACAFLAMPFFYRHRLDDAVFAVGVGAFMGVPLIAGFVQERAHRLLLPIAVILLLLCPVVYAVTDRLAAEWERPRDGYFLAVGSTVEFVSAAWVVSSIRARRRFAVATAAVGLGCSMLGVFFLLAVVMYLE